MGYGSTSINMHTDGESPVVNVGGNEYATWATVRFGNNSVTFFMTDEWGIVSLADHILSAAAIYREDKRLAEATAETEDADEWAEFYPEDDADDSVL